MSEEKKPISYAERQAEEYYDILMSHKPKAAKLILKSIIQEAMNDQRKVCLEAWLHSELDRNQEYKVIKNAKVE